MLAALNGHKEVVELLILCGANINSKDNVSNTLLYNYYCGMAFDQLTGYDERANSYL